MPRKLTRWGQFVAMGMAQLAGRCSLRDIVSNLSAQSRKLYHLGIGEVSRSSLARVNAEKPWELYRDLFGALLSRCRLVSPGHGFRFRNPLYSLDSTVLDLCLSAFPWATFRQTKGGLKAHVALDHAGHLPAFVTVTDAKTADIEAARSLRLPKGSIVVADRAYMDFKRIDSLILQGVFLVTRPKRRIRYHVAERREADRRPRLGGREPVLSLLRPALGRGAVAAPLDGGCERHRVGRRAGSRAGDGSPGGGLLPAAARGVGVRGPGSSSSGVGGTVRRRRRCRGIGSGGGRGARGCGNRRREGAFRDAGGPEPLGLHLAAAHCSKRRSAGSPASRR